MDVLDSKVVRKHKVGYEIREELWGNPPNKPIKIRTTYTPSRDWIGDLKTAHYLCVKRGIAPEKSSPKHCVCSIGFCEKEQKWYGWSHRAICGFGLNDMIFEERFGNDKTPFIKHGKKPIMDFSDAKLAAKRFASSVS
ncbi:unnamed protein product [marine sediment metagenome]|uniref:Uncharacterized protein n=1 Tax=marine sediment metagenome TaxID=412755 RepID=X1GZL3_9ZZZZ